MPSIMDQISPADGISEPDFDQYKQVSVPWKVLTLPEKAEEGANDVRITSRNI